MDNLFHQTRGRGLYDYQKKLFQDNRKFKIVNKSRQIGISYSLACWGLLNALLLNKTVLIVSPSERQSKHIMDYTKEFLYCLQNDFNISLREETKTSYIFTDGGEIHSFPNNSNAIRGYPADIIIIDEFAHFLNKTDRDIVTAITPSVIRNPNCEVFYVSTPFGDKNLFYEYWHNSNKDIARFKINWRECPDIQEDEILDMKNVIGEDAFLQEYENQFLTDVEGQEFPMELIQSCVDPEIQLYSDPAQAFQHGEKYVGGVDIGRRHDFTAIITLHKQDDKYVVNFKQTFKNKPYSEQTNILRYILNRGYFEYFTVDETGIGSEMAETLRHEYHVNTVSFTNENKQEMVMNLKKMMQNKKIVLPDDTQIINSIRSIQRIYTSNNYLRFDSPRTEELGHADVFWSLALAVYPLRKKHGRRGFRL